MHQSITSVREIVSKITTKGQITIPSEVRKHLGVKTNDKIAFVIAREGEVSVKSPSYPSIDSLAGAAGSLIKPFSWKKMRQIAREDRFQAKYK